MQIVLIGFVIENMHWQTIHTGATLIETSIDMQRHIMLTQQDSYGLLRTWKLRHISVGERISLKRSAVSAVSFNNRFTVTSSQGHFDAASLVVASGGLSIPKMGASGFGYQLAQQFGHTVIDTTAGLVPLTFTGAMHELTERLSGVGTPASVSTNDVAFTDDILFTHRGLSGPAVLQLSSYWSPGDEVRIDLLPGMMPPTICSKPSGHNPNRCCGQCLALPSLARWSASSSHYSGRKLLKHR